MKRTFLFLSVITILSACTPEGQIYKENKDLSPDVEWLKKDTRSFEVPIKDTSATYDLSINFRFAEGYQFEIAAVEITETAPDGTIQSKKNYNLQIRDKTGKYLGEPGYDIWDSTHLIEKNKKFSQQGVYTFTIAQNMPADPLNYAMEIGMIVQKSKP